MHIPHSCAGVASAEKGKPLFMYVLWRGWCMEGVVYGEEGVHIDTVFSAACPHTYFSYPTQQLQTRSADEVCKVSMCIVHHTILFPHAFTLSLSLLRTSSLSHTAHDNICYMCQLRQPLEILVRGCLMCCGYVRCCLHMCACCHSCTFLTFLQST